MVKKTNNAYFDTIIKYYSESENAYKDTWNLNESLSIHYGYWDKKVRNFHESLWRMNEILSEKAQIKKSDKVLDAGCGIGGSSIWLAKNIQCTVTGISISEKQINNAQNLAFKNNVNELVKFEQMNYCKTDFEDESFDIVWALESVCYAENKLDFIKEAFRILKPNGRLILADGMVNQIKNNNHPIVRKWLDGWVVNYLETPENWKKYALNTGFRYFEYNDITPFIQHSSKRLLLYSIAGYVWAMYRKYIVRKPFTELQLNNTKGAWYQYWGLKRKLWNYGLFITHK
jgi:tocopherol O-methyltransferase